MKKNIKYIILLLALFASTSCDVEGQYRDGVQIRSAATLNSGVVIHESEERRLIYLSPDNTTITLKEFYRSGDNEHLMWAKRGPSTTNPTEYFQMVIPIDEREADFNESLLRFSFENDEINTTTYEVNSPFNKLFFGPQEEYAILYHSDDQDATDYDVFNPNEVAILKLNEAPSETNPIVMSVDLSGHRITGISFLPTVSVGGVEMQFVVFKAKGVVRLVDLLNTESTKRIKLITDDDPRNVIPKQVIVRDADETRNPMIFIRATNSQDVYAITLSPDLEGDSEFVASMNQYEAWGDPLDMEMIQDGADPYLLVLSSGTSSQGNSSIINIVDIDTSHSFTIVVNDRPNNLLLRQGELGEEVVVYGNNTDAVFYLQPDGVAEEQGHNLDDVDIPDGINETILLDENRLLILPDSHQDIILLNLDTRKTTRFSAPNLSDDDWNSAQIYGDYFFFVPGSNDRIGLVDLTTDHPDSLLMDDYISSLHLVKETNMGMCIHQTGTGRVTIFPLDDPTRESSTIIDGLWLLDFLDGKEVSQ